MVGSVKDHGHNSFNCVMRTESRAMRNVIRSMFTRNVITVKWKRLARWTQEKA